MTTSAPTHDFSVPSLSRADRTLGWTTTGWFAVAVFGQLFFAAYVAMFYGGTALNGAFDRWDDVGYQEGSTVRNIVIMVHLLVAMTIMVGGPLQFITAIRQRFPVFHRWNGRVYVLLTALGGLSGLYMIWTRQLDAAQVNKMAMSLEALLIVVAGFLVYRFAVKRKMQQHQAWAFRLFLVASGVWFFRVLLMFWFMATGGLWIDTETFTGPFLSFIAYAHYLLPLAVYELYLLAKRRGGVNGRYAMAGLMVVCTLITAIGVFAAAMGMWLPEM
ncbi:DUF2306 domain-containing protein [Neolewinella persica]|uniref:DUF2306 domain-containing protein n=1 Tax=Neolewinella persica TaxID=70998 RepID=UPI00039E1871|nr:DUF2306 domain-containing protein [Neolewinella persica]